MPVLTRLIAIAAIATISSPASAETLQPIGKWTVDYGATACLAGRNFGDPKEPMFLAFRPSLNDKTVRLMIVRGERRTAAQHFQVNVSGVKATGLRYFARESKRQVIWINLEQAQFDRIAAGKNLTLGGEGIKLDFSLAGTAAAVRAMRTCNADLRKHWNADEPGLARIATPAKPLVSPGKLISSNEYPSQALNELRGGTTRIALLVDEQGATKDCVVEEHSGVATLDAQTCIIVLKRAKFEPARDRAGKPVKSFLSYGFKWQVQ